MESADGPSTAGLGGAARQVLSTLIDMGQTRLELAGVELEEERLHIGRLLLTATITLFAAFVAVVLLAGLIVMLAGEDHRLAALAALCGLACGTCALGVWRWRRLCANKPPLLHATLAELQRDKAALAGKAAR